MLMDKNLLFIDVLDMFDVYSFEISQPSWLPNQF